MKEFMTEEKKEDSSIEYIIIENGEEKKNENKDNIESESDKNADKSRKRKIKKRINNCYDFRFFNAILFLYICSICVFYNDYKNASK